MRYLALVTDYDGVVASDGQSIWSTALAAIERCESPAGGQF